MSGVVSCQCPERMSDFSKVTQLVRQTQGDKKTSADSNSGSGSHCLEDFGQAPSFSEPQFPLCTMCVSGRACEKGGASKDVEGSGPHALQPAPPSHRGGRAQGPGGGGRKLLGAWTALPHPAPAVGQPGAVSVFAAGAAWTGLYSFTGKFTVNRPLSVRCPERRSPGEEVRGALATCLTSSIVTLLPERRLHPGAQQGDGRGVEGGVLPALCPFTRGWGWQVRERRRWGVRE